MLSQPQERKQSDLQLLACRDIPRRDHLVVGVVILDVRRAGVVEVRAA